LVPPPIIKTILSPIIVQSPKSKVQSQSKKQKAKSKEQSRPPATERKFGGKAQRWSILTTRLDNPTWQLFGIWRESALYLAGKVHTHNNGTKAERGRTRTPDPDPTMDHGPWTMDHGP